MINTIITDGEGSNSKNKNELDELLANMRADCVDYQTYQEIYSMIPQDLICEKDRNMGNEEELGFPTNMTKWMLNKEIHKDLLLKLRDFAKKNNLIKNQLAFNEHFDDYFIRTIYKPN